MEEGTIGEGRRRLYEEEEETIGGGRRMERRSCDGHAVHACCSLLLRGSPPLNLIRIKAPSSSMTTSRQQGGQAAVPS